MSEIKYYLVAEVDGIDVFNAEYPDTTMLQEELYKAERAVETELLEMEYENE
jgi:hypothetical protein